VISIAVSRQPDGGAGHADIIGVRDAGVWDGGSKHGMATFRNPNYVLGELRRAGRDWQ